MYRVIYSLPEQVAEVRVFESLDNATSFTTSLSIMNLSYTVEKIQ